MTQEVYQVNENQFVWRLVPHSEAGKDYGKFWQLIRVDSEGKEHPDSGWFHSPQEELAYIRLCQSIGWAGGHDRRREQCGQDPVFHGFLQLVPPGRWVCKSCDFELPG